jgi:hypothetical protein
VACTLDGYVAIIDLKSLEVTGHIEAGKQPDGLAWAVTLVCLRRRAGMSGPAVAE